jgi:hypothetical protein
MGPGLQPVEEQDFKAGLWQLHEQTSKLPPLTDCQSLDNTCFCLFRTQVFNPQCPAKLLFSPQIPFRVPPMISTKVRLLALHSMAWPTLTPFLFFVGQWLDKQKVGSTCKQNGSNPLNPVPGCITLPESFR